MFLYKEKSPGLLSLPSASPPLTDQGSSSPVPVSDVSVSGSFCFSSSTFNFTSFSSSCQSDFVEQNQLEFNFIPKKKYSLLLADSYKRLCKQKKAQRVFDCGSFLEFRHAEISLGSGIFEKEAILHNANFCRDRLCPMCSWRRSLKIFGQCSQIMDVIGSQYDFIFVTLTIPSVPDFRLSEAIDLLLKGWRSLYRKKRVKTAVKGFYRALEITRNNDFLSKSYGLFHPHFHCIFAVSKSYFTSRDYIRQSEWLQLWRDSFCDQSITQVDVRRVYPKQSFSGSFDISSAVSEAAKYTVKSSDYIFPDDEVLTDEIVGCLSSALVHRRLVSFGGCFKKVWHQLQLDDPEDGDLLNLSGFINPQLRYLITRFGWSAGCYKLNDYYYLENGQPVFCNS